MKNYFISKDIICLKYKPRKDNPKGITIKYINWFMEERISYYGEAWCYINKGEELYELPPSLRGLNKLRIYSIKVCRN